MKQEIVSTEKGKFDTLLNEPKKKKKQRKQRDTREEKAKKMLYDGKVTRIARAEEVYKVESESTPDMYYKVYVRSLKVESCTCKDFELNHEIDQKHKCKHMRLVELAQEQSFAKTELASTKLSYEVDEYGF